MCAGFHAITRLCSTYSVIPSAANVFLGLYVYPDYPLPSDVAQLGSSSSSFSLAVSFSSSLDLDLPFEFLFLFSNTPIHVPYAYTRLRTTHCVRACSY